MNYVVVGFRFVVRR